MFGWLSNVFPMHAFPSFGSRPRGAMSPCRHALALPSGVLASHLPLLDCVLYLPLPSHADAWVSPGWLVERRELAALPGTKYVIAASAIGVDGPREWLECVDALGRLRARIYLLPDTDYCAWDTLLSLGRPLARLPSVLDASPHQPARAELLQFRSECIGGLSMLGSRVVSSVSPLGREMARDIARSASAVLELSGE